MGIINVYTYVNKSPSTPFAICNLHPVSRTFFPPIVATSTWAVKLRAEEVDEAYHVPKYIDNIQKGYLNLV